MGEAGRFATATVGRIVDDGEEIGSAAFFLGEEADGVKGVGDSGLLVPPNQARGFRCCSHVRFSSGAGMLVTAAFCVERAAVEVGGGEGGKMEGRLVSWRGGGNTGVSTCATIAAVGTGVGSGEGLTAGGAGFGAGVAVREEDSSFVWAELTGGGGA